MKKSIAGIAVASLLVLAGCGNSQANLPKMMPQQQEEMLQKALLLN